MKIEEEMERKRWWVLKTIKRASAHPAGNRYIDFKIKCIKNSEDKIFPNPEEQMKILFELNMHKVIDLGYNTNGKDSARFVSKMRRKGMAWHPDIMAEVPPSGIITLTVNKEKLDQELGFLDIKYSGDYRTFENDGIVLFERIKEVKESPWITCKCGGLKLNTNTGEAFLYNTRAEFTPDGQEFNLLSLLLSDCGHRYTHDEISVAIKKRGGADYRDLSFVIRNIKNKLEITGPNKNNDDIFKSSNGYWIVC